jgi:copper chaperone CopZ
LVHELSGINVKLFELNAVTSVSVKLAEDSVTVFVGDRKVNLELLEEVFEEAADLLSVE